MSRLEELTAFCHIVETASITDAAKRMHVAKSAISRRLKDLEDRLGTQLLVRTTRSVALTEAGEHFFIRAKQILADLTEAEQFVIETSKGLSGRLRISLPVSFGRMHLTPILLNFLKKHPGLDFDFTFDDHRSDLIAERFDIAFRIGDLPDSSLKAKKLADIAIMLACSPKYLETHKLTKPSSAEDLSKYNLLYYSNVMPRDQWFYTSPDGTRSHIRLKAQNMANNGEFLAEAAIAGFGIAKLPRFIISDALDKGDLIDILPQYNWGNTALYAVYPPSRYLSSRVRECIDYVASIMAKQSY